MTTPTDQASFVAAVLADLHAAPYFADWLQDNGREREAVLLRRRYGMWQTQRRDAMLTSLLKAHAWGFGDAWAEQYQAVIEDGYDDSLRAYVRSRFGAKFTRGRAV